MKSSTPIVANGGWTTRRTIGRPRARFFGFLSLAWLLLSAIAGLVLWADWPPRFDWLSGCLVLLLAVEPVWIALAAVHLFREQPREITQYLPNPDRDPHNLH
jgi:hypothetical protein